MGGGGSQTQTQISQPWGPSQPYLKDALADAGDLYESGGFHINPYSGDRTYGFGDVSLLGQGQVVDQALQGAPLVGQASDTLSGMMDYDYQSGLLDNVKNNALGSAIPAAVAQFAGSGMGNSSLAMDTVGRAATDAIAPYEYGAHENTLARMMGAAGMAPQIEQAGYIPGQMMQGVGAIRDQMGQQEINADMQAWYENQNMDVNALQNYSNLLMGYGGQGGTQVSETSSESGPMDFLGGGLQGLAFLQMLSDRRLKRDIERVGETPGGHNLYSFKYLWDDTEHTGVMADEVPHAIAGYVDGFAVVDYARVF